MRKKNFLFNFLMFSMLILIILIVMLIFQEYENKYEIPKSQYNKKASIESSLVRSDSKNANKQEKIVEKEKSNIASNSLKNNEKEICEIQQEDEVQITDIYYLIQNEANANKNFIDNVLWQVSIIPNDIINTFIEREYIICITNENLKNKLTLVQGETYYDNIKIVGFLDRTDGVMYNYYDGNTTNDTYTIIHEFGHFADFFVYGNPSATEEFGQIYDKEHISIQSQTNININNERELFAEMFKCVLIQKAEYEKFEAYQYVKDIIYHN